MNKTNPLKRRFGVSLVCLALVLPGIASAQLTVTGANQSGQAGVYPFTPSWTPDSANSLINGLAPSFTSGNFNLDNTNCNVNSLTSGGSLAINTTTVNNPAGPDAIGSGATSGNYVTCGNRVSTTVPLTTAGNVIVYTLPVSAKGYNLTNITVFSGWADNGRDSQSYSVLYSTAANPSSFNYLTSVNYRPTVPSSTASSCRVIIDAAGATMVSNVVAVKFVWDVPTSENSWCGYGAITIGGTPSASVAAPVVSVTTTNENGASPFTPDWTPETPNLIAGLAPGTATGNFIQEGAAGTNVLTDGTIGISGDLTTFASVGNGGGNTLIYTLTNVVNGSDVTNIVVYSGWGNADRDGQYYTLSYSTVAAPGTFIPITTVYYNPRGVSGASANRVAIAMNDGSPLGSGVANLKFAFNTLPSAGSFDNGYQGFSEIIVQGHDTTAPPPPPSPYLTQDTLPTYAETVVGDQVVFTAAYSNVPPASLQWQVVSTDGKTTNDVPGATSTNLTLNNVQLTDSGFYRLKAVNATNGAAAPSYSTVAQLVVSNTPAAVNGVIVNYAGQTFPSSSTNFLPAWPVDTNDLNLISGFTAGSGEGTFTYAGDFTGGGNFCNGDPTILSDGIVASMTSLPNLAFSGCGTLVSQTGYQITYALVTNSAPYGLDLTNITVFGGWQDAGRDEQKYQVLYSTVQAPASFAPLVTADYVPTDSGGTPVVTRTTLVPATGVLAHNVAVLKISWNVSPNPKNNWEGYSEILAGGRPSTGFVPTLTNDVTPSAASDVVGSQLILTAGFSGATSLQWQFNGTNILGATTSTLTLNNLQFTNAGVYALVASNAAGTSHSGGCTVTVNSNSVPANNIITAIATQTSIAEVFTPTWDPSQLAASLFYNAAPSSSGEGDFTAASITPSTAASGPSVLTDGTFGTIDFNQTGTHSWVTCMGSGGGGQDGSTLGGQYVIYSLPASANGYDITNIMTAGGWNDAGRDQQSYTINYATAANPTYFTPLATVNYNPGNPVGYSMVRATITPANGVLASNVVALEFDMTTPAGENGFSGYSEIAAYGSPSATPPPVAPAITVQHEETSFDWTVETDNLIANQLPGSQGPGSFTQEGCTEGGLTDGVLAFGGGPNSASCGSTNSPAVQWIVFAPTNGGTWNLSNIVVYTLWHDFGRDGQFYNVSYSTPSAPSTFLPLAGIAYNPPVPHTGIPTGNRIAIAPPTGQTMLATNVAALKFDFTPQGNQDFAWSGYTEIVLQGTNLASTIVIPPTFNKPVLSGGNLILTGSGGTPNTGYTLLTATNLTPPVNWTTNTTGSLDGAGSFSNGVPVSNTPPARFFRVRLP
jgi:hypothetical protein